MSLNRALYKGFVPKALRLGLGQTIGLMTFNKVSLPFMSEPVVPCSTINGF